MARNATADRYPQTFPGSSGPHLSARHVLVHTRHQRAREVCRVCDEDAVVRVVRRPVLAVHLAAEPGGGMGGGH